MPLILHRVDFSTLIIKSKMGFLFRVGNIVFDECLTFVFILRHDDLKQMLDVNKDSMKLEAMKRIIGVNIILIRSFELIHDSINQILSKCR